MQFLKVEKQTLQLILIQENLNGKLKMINFIMIKKMKDVKYVKVLIVEVIC